jgi:hypothetical protein
MQVKIYTIDVVLHYFAKQNAQGRKKIIKVYIVCIYVYSTDASMLKYIYT